MLLTSWHLPCWLLVPSAVVLTLLGAAPSHVRGAEASTDRSETAKQEQLEFFEKQIRPVLVEHCVECHGDKKQQAGLRIDSREALLKGNESGPALVPGQPGESRLVRVLRYSSDDIQMPPAGKLADHHIQAFEKWVEMGAPWPTTASLSTPAGSPEGKNGSAAETHWAFRPVSDPPIPTVSSLDRIQTSVDPFILSQLEAKTLTMSPPADKATFIRRATLDLWGIPPTYDEVQAFVKDPSPQAVSQLIDRLLDSPLYGQRWGRHWLDIARYADTKGYVFTEEPRYPYAYTYRDYVVDSFNSDKPYDRFLMEQIAADQMPVSADQSELAALGFLTVGRRFLNKREDIIDDRIDVVTRGMMALTVGCARCHDHKYDPIPTADYYSLFGVFASCEEPADLPIIGSPKSREDFEAFQKSLSELEKGVADFEQQKGGEINAQLKTDAAVYLTLVVEPKANEAGHPSKPLITSEPRMSVVDRWKRFLNDRKDPRDRVFGPWNQLVGQPDEAFKKSAADWVEKAKTDPAVMGQVHPLVRQALIETPLNSKVDLAQVYGKSLASIHQQWLDLQGKQAEVMALPDAHAEELRQILYAENSPTQLNIEDTRKAYLRNERTKHAELVKKIETLKVTSPGAPARAMVMKDRERPEEPRIFIRGNPGRPGDPVPRRFLEVLSGKERAPFSKGSGRLELAQAIASPTNPLTARVIVNRVWQHHFGEGLSRIPGDFGIRGEAPTHPALLDHLATQLIQQKWSLKWLHRTIMNSATYAQSSIDRPDARAIDPENRLYWKMPRNRLEFEAQRDSWLAVAGRLDTSLGGRPFENINDPNAVRRTLYGFVNRNDLPGLFRSFDFADVDVSMAERPETTVPQQALFAMNSQFMIEQSRRLATSVQSEPDDNARVTALFRKALSRDPRHEEREAALVFVKTAPHEGQLSNWDKLAQALLLTNEFVFVD